MAAVDNAGFSNPQLLPEGDGQLNLRGYYYDQGNKGDELFFRVNFYPPSLRLKPS